MDEPTSALDPISTSKIEDLVVELKNDYTIIIVTHNMQQAVRIADSVAFFLNGEVIEYARAEKLFYMPQENKFCIVRRKKVCLKLQIFQKLNTSHIADMAKATIKMVTDSIDAYVQQNLKLRQSV